jgi:hypothetical protein
VAAEAAELEGWVQDIVTGAGQVVEVEWLLPRIAGGAVSTAALN